MTQAFAARCTAILHTARGETVRQARLGAVIVAVCIAALAITGFFDAARFIEGGPAIAQLCLLYTSPSPRD